MGLPDPTVVFSGGGLHVYWPLKDALGPVEWKRYSEGLKAACLARGLKAEHKCTANAALVLRLPGTTNRKLAGKPRLVTLDPRFLRVEPYDLACFDLLLKYAPGTAAGKNVDSLRILPPRPAYLDNIAWPSEVFPDLYPPAGAHLIADQCAHVGRMRETRGRLPYPEWFGCIGVVAHCEDGPRIAHDWSKGDQRYDPKETQEKIDAWVKMTGPTTCDHFSGCGSKPHAFTHFQVKTTVHYGSHRWLPRLDLVGRNARSLGASDGGEDNQFAI